ncbi:MAG: hypothetical protein M0D55_05890 [Elusimicrobiota bacterium]|nr:MAG: hypothetical protein M0D55_05890 [Elusimicrobiota bacterium]
MTSPRRDVSLRSAAVLAACALLVLAFAPAQYFGRQQDDVLYLVGARALAMGRYCLLTDPACPPLTMINPLWPALLAPLSWITESVGLFQAASALLLALAPAGVWLWLRRRLGETEALLGAALFASSPLVLAQAGVVMSEIPYTLALLGLLLAADAGNALPAGLSAAALLLTRTAGIAALPALAFARKGKDRARAWLPPLLAFAGWSAYSYSRSRTVEKLDMLGLTYGDRAAAKLASVAASNAAYYARGVGACFLPPSLAEGPAALALGAALLLGAAWGGLSALRRRRDDPAALALAGSAALLAVWGWQYERYLLPLLPLLYWALASALGARAPRALAALLVLQLGFQVAPRIGRPSPWAEPELARTYAWLAARPAGSLLTSAHNVRDGWLSGLPSRPLPLVEDDAEFAAALKRAKITLIVRADGLDYGLLADPDAGPVRELARINRRLEDPRFFRKVHEEPSERATVYEPR